MIKRFVAVTALVWGLAACNNAANSPIPVIESVDAKPAQVTDGTTPFVITWTMRAGQLDTSGALPAGLTRPGSFKILSPTVAEWRPAGDAGGTLPAGPVYLPVTLVGASGFGVVGQTQSQTLYVQFDPIPGGLAFKGYRTVLPSASPQ